MAANLQSVHRVQAHPSAARAGGPTDPSAEAEREHFVPQYTVLAVEIHVCGGMVPLFSRPCYIVLHLNPFTHQLDFAYLWTFK